MLRTLGRGLTCGALLCAAILATGHQTTHASVIGPDTFGYSATNDVPFNYVSIAGTGTQVLADDDDDFVSVNIGFTFWFYGQSYTTVYFSPNGLMTFGFGTSAWLNYALDNSIWAPGPAIAPLWDDWVTLDFVGADAVYYQTRGTPGSREFVVQWNRVDHLGVFADEVTFQAVLFEGTNDILFLYPDVITGNNNTNKGASATVGIKDVNGHSNGRYLQWSYNTPVLYDGEAILFRAPTAPVPEPSTLAGLVGIGGSVAGIGLGRRRRPRK